MVASFSIEIAREMEKVKENETLRIGYNIPSWSSDSTLHFDLFEILMCSIGKLPALFNLFRKEF